MLQWRFVLCARINNIELIEETATRSRRRFFNTNENKDMETTRSELEDLAALLLKNNGERVSRLAARNFERAIELEYLSVATEQQEVREACVV